MNFACRLLKVMKEEMLIELDELTKMISHSLQIELLKVDSENDCDGLVKWFNEARSNDVSSNHFHLLYHCRRCNLQ